MNGSFMKVIGPIACLTLALTLPARAQQEAPMQEPSQQEQPEQQQPQQQQPQQDQDEQPRPQEQQSVEIDTNLFCDTEQQVQRFVSLLDEKGGSAEAALDSVNAENNASDACVIATVAYRPAGRTGEVKNGGGATFDVVRIVVLGVYTVRGLEAAQPTELFTLALRDGDGTVGQRPQP
jgi:hemolysin activation/secretion protein